MWQMIEVPPQPYGECTVCKRHTCGEYDDNGVKRQKWAYLPLEMDKGGNLVIGYQCIKGMSEDAGVSLRVVEKLVEVKPSDEQVLRVFRESSAQKFADGIRDAFDTEENHDLMNSDSPMAKLIQEQTQQHKTSKRGASK